MASPTFCYWHINEHQIFFSPRPRPAVRGPSTPPAPRHWAGRHQLDQQHPAGSGAQQQQGRLAVGRGVASGGATEGGRPAARISEAISTSLLQINQQPWRRARTPSSGCTPTTSMIWICFSEPLWFCFNVLIWFLTSSSDIVFTSFTVAYWFTTLISMAWTRNSLSEALVSWAMRFTWEVAD